MQDAVLLAGSLGLGHEMLARSCAGLMERLGWRTRRLNSMSLLGPWNRVAGERLFGRMVSMPGLYDGLHFAHLRAGSRLAALMDRAASARLVPALQAELQRQPADVVLSVFATGASAAAKLKAEMPALRTIVLCTDVAVHRIWVSEGTDLFLVTSAAAAASVRRYFPSAPVAIVPPPVRSAFYAAPPGDQARAALGVPSQAFCVLLIDSGWGFGSLVETVSALSDTGAYVLAVAGRKHAVEQGLRELAATTPRVIPFGFTDRVPELMAAADVVVALPGATTCAEARVVGRELLLLDVMPGHGRDNLLHELELGSAHVCPASPREIAVRALALRDEALLTASRAVCAPRWEPAFVAALEQIGLDLQGMQAQSGAPAEAPAEAPSGAPPGAPSGAPSGAPAGAPAPPAATAPAFDDGVQGADRP